MLYLKKRKVNWSSLRQDYWLEDETFIVGLITSAAQILLDSLICH